MKLAVFDGLTLLLMKVEDLVFLSSVDVCLFCLTY